MASAVQHNDGFTDAVGRPFGWTYAVADDGSVEFTFHASTEVKEKLVEKSVSLALSLSQLAALAHSAQAARNHALERQAMARQNGR